MSATRRGSLLVIFLTVFIDLLGFGIVLPLLPIYADQFSVKESGWMLGALMASFSVMQFFFAPLWGRLSDRIGRRPVLLIGLAGSVVFYTLFGIATILKSLPLLLVTRIGAGVAGATVSTAQAYIADVTSLQERPRGMALIGMAFGLGFTFGPLFGLLAAPSGNEDPGPWPGYAAAILSGGALLLAYFRLPESRTPESKAVGKKIFDVAAFGRALATPSIGPLLFAIFTCVFSFAIFETTLSLLLKGQRMAAASPFHFGFRAVCLTFAFIGLTLAVVQGGIVRRLAGRVSEGRLASGGVLTEVIGFLLMVAALAMGSVGMLYAALFVVVSGFAFTTPSLNSLLSRRTAPGRQGEVLGVGQSVNSLARIIGALVGIPLLAQQLTFPYYAAAGLMAVGFLLVVFAARSGKDFTPEAAAVE